MDDDASCRNQHPSAELQQTFAKHANLGAGASGASGPQAQLLHQDICGGGEQDAELVGPEAGATGAVDLKVVQFLDAVFDVAALAVELFVNPLGTLFHIVMTKRGLSLGSLSEARTTSALMMTRRGPGHVRAA